jgi:hypothetical protein
MVVTEGYLKKFASTQLQGFLDTKKNSLAVAQIMAYVPGTAEAVLPGSVDTYATVMPGNRGFLPEAGRLQDAHRTFSDNLKQALMGIFAIAEKMQADLASVEEIIDRGENDAELTAAEMVAVLGDIWKPPSSSQSTSTDLTGLFPPGSGNT